MIELEENVDHNTLIGMFKHAAINAVDNHTRVISGIISLIKNRDDLCENFHGKRNKLFSYLFLILAVNETLALIRRQYEEFEQEKQNLLLEHSSREEISRLELEKIQAEKEY